MIYLVNFRDVTNLQNQIAIAVPMRPKIKGPMQSRKILRIAPTQIDNEKHDGSRDRKTYL